MENNNQSDVFQVFNLALRAYKFETSFLGPVNWFTICSVQLLKDDDTLSVTLAEAYLDSAVTNSIEGICLLVDKVMVQEWPLFPIQQIDASIGVTI
jgi:hypothetical protein